MTRRLITATAAAFAGCLLATAAIAKPVSLSLDQMDTVAGGTFVCPVISTDAVLNAQGGIQINGAYSILGPEVAVPVGATNGDGTGSPGGTYASPGDSDYTAIWN